VEEEVTFVTFPLPPSGPAPVPPTAYSQWEKDTPNSSWERVRLGLEEGETEGVGVGVGEAEGVVLEEGEAEGVGEASVEGDKEREGKGEAVEERVVVLLPLPSPPPPPPPSPLPPLLPDAASEGVEDREGQAEEEMGEEVGVSVPPDWLLVWGAGVVVAARYGEMVAPPPPTPPPPPCCWGEKEALPEGLAGSDTVRVESGGERVGRGEKEGERVEEVEGEATPVNLGERVEVGVMVAYPLPHPGLPVPAARVV
jgi:hypothetical protein